MEGSNLANGNSFKSRRTLDYYPTPKNVTIALMDFLKMKPCVVWECACGTREMSSVIKSYGHTVIETDITTGTDYLNTINKCDAIITNPPFALAESFIRKAITEAPLVAMLLKSQYWHSSKRLDLFNLQKPRYILPLTWRPDFMFGESGGSPTMEVLWSVWIKGESITEYIPLKKPIEIKCKSFF